MSTGNCVELAPWFCGPFIVLKYIGSSTYRLALPNGIEIHPFFHLSHLKELLGCSANTVKTKTLVTFGDLACKPYVSEKIHVE